MTWVDSHCHLQYKGMAPDAVEDAVAAGVTRIICIGTDGDESARAVEVARSHPGRVWATVGLHPHDASHGVDGVVRLLDAPEVVAVGECGLDYHYDHSPREAQREAFAAQVALAHERDLALVVHTREAWDDTFAILDGEGIPGRTVFHCFTGGPEEARRVLDAGAYLSFSGIVTFKRADDVRQAAALTPLDRLLVETDAPFLTPEPHRGTPNAPALVPLVGAAVARAKGLTAEEVEAATTATAEKIFRLPGAAG
ncbi:MAG TPA: TatD family hydrolase [Acidimicrobiales bacterium]|nr:TatD family hydrolase [Acidimicrobiales bacterium]